MSRSENVKCDMCGKKKGDALHWAVVTSESSYYAFDDGTIEENHTYDLCPGCKAVARQLLSGGMKETIQKYLEALKGE